MRTAHPPSIGLEERRGPPPEFASDEGWLGRMHAPSDCLRRHAYVHAPAQMYPARTATSRAGQKDAGFGRLIA